MMLHLGLSDLIIRSHSRIRVVKTLIQLLNHRPPLLVVGTATCCPRA